MVAVVLTLFVLFNLFHSVPYMKRLTFFIFFISISVSLNQAYAQSQGCKFAGKLTDEHGQAIELASVSLNNSLVAFTNKDGLFEFLNVPAGRYDYRITFVGYETVSGAVAINAHTPQLKVQMRELGLQLKTVEVTARQQAMGSKSLIGQDAIRHIQPKSVTDILQLVPGNLIENPMLNKLAQAHIREIDGDRNNALGALVVVDGTPVSNDANLQVLGTARFRASSGAQADGMGDQTTAGRGADLRTVSAGNVESVEVIRGIPSVEYGNLTSGMLIVKTKMGHTPWEVKAQADPFSKLLYVGKGFNLKCGGAVNFSADWSQSWADTRKHSNGYDRLTFTGGYSKTAGRNTFSIKGAFYSNVNNRKDDPQYREMQLRFTNKNIGTRLSVSGKYHACSTFLSALSYNLSLQYSKTTDQHDNLVSNPDGVITDVRTPGIHPAIFKNKSYFSKYEILGAPLNLYGQVVGNKYLQLGTANYTNVKLGVEFVHSANHGKGLLFDMQNPPLSMGTQTLRPRAFKDIPALNTLSAFVSDKLSLQVFQRHLTVEGGLRVSNLFLNKRKSGGKRGMFVAEPRLNASYTLLDKTCNSWIDELSLTGGYGISNKMPTLMYLYPDNVYDDNVCLSKYGEREEDRLALLQTDVIEQVGNPDLMPTHTQKWECGLTFRIGKVRGFVTYYNERHHHEFGFESRLYWNRYPKFSLPVEATLPKYHEETGDVSYLHNGVRLMAGKTEQVDMSTWSRPTNNTRSHKHGIEYGIDLGSLSLLRTSLSINGAWFHTERTDEKDQLRYVDYNYDYVPVMPSGSGYIRDRVNSTFRFVTHVPAVKMIFTTAVQVVWYESEREVYRQPDGKSRYHQFTYEGREYLGVSPIGYYTRDGHYYPWSADAERDVVRQRMMGRYYLYDFEKDVTHPWVLLSLRFTKEIGKVAELSFTANNFPNVSRWHTNPHSLSRTQLYPAPYFGAEVKIKL